MRSVLVALLTPAAIAITASAAAAVPVSRASIIESSPVTIDVAYTPEGQLSGALTEAYTTAVPLLEGVEECTAAARMRAEAFTQEAAELTDAAVRMRAEAFTRGAADLTDAAACIGTETFTRAAGTSLTADITALERKPANDVADWAPLQGTKP